MKEAAANSNYLPQSFKKATYSDRKSLRRMLAGKLIKPISGEGNVAWSGALPGKFWPEPAGADKAGQAATRAMCQTSNQSRVSGQHILTRAAG